MTRLILFLFTVVAFHVPLHTAFQPLPRRTIDNSVTAKGGYFAPSQQGSIESAIRSLPDRTSSLFMSDGDGESSSSLSLIGIAGLASQPIVWISLYFVKTTGAGLPSGPYGLVGGIEGLSYLAVLILAVRNVASSNDGSDVLETAAEKVSLLTLLVALGTLLSLVVDQGCVPNAKPILDYSAYLPVCNPEEAPGFFGL